MENYEKKYKEALERAKNLHKDAIDMGENIRAKQYEIIFPELAESEDEKIRKTIHIYLDWLDGRKDCAPRGEYSISDMIAWLEKQGQKPTNKDKELTCKDIEIILGIENHILHECNYNSQLVIEAYPKGEDYYGEILKRFNNQRIKPQCIISAETKEAMCNKPAWSEGNKETFKGVMDAFVNNFKKYIKGE